MSPGLQVATWVVGTLVAVVGAYFAYRTIQPRPLLVIYITQTPLATRQEVAGVNDRLTIHHGALGALDGPALVLVVVRNASRADVTASHFDSGKALRLDLGVPIMERLKTVTNRPGQDGLAVSVDSSALLIGPGLITRGQNLEYSCLVDGVASLSLTHSLAHIDLEGRRPEDLERPHIQRRKVLPRVAIGLALAGVTIAGMMPAIEHRLPGTQTEIPRWSGLILVVLALLLGALSWFERRRARRDYLGV